MRPLSHVVLQRSGWSEMLFGEGRNQLVFLAGGWGGICSRAERFVDRKRKPSRLKPTEKAGLNRIIHRPTASMDFSEVF